MRRSVPIVKVHARKQGVRSPVKELQGNIAAHVPQQAVIAHSECIFGVVAVGVPSIDRSHSAGIWRDESGKRKDAMAIIATPCCERRNHSVAQPRKHTFALATAIQSIFAKSLRECIERRCGYGRDAEVLKQNACRNRQRPAATPVGLSSA